MLPNQRTSSGGAVASIRITEKFRARVTRDGVFMRFISLHPDHDSAYKISGWREYLDPVFFATCRSAVLTAMLGSSMPD